MSDVSDRLSRAALAGAASGGRTFTGLAALAVATPTGPARQPDRTLATGIARALITVGAATEIALDKLPMAPSRLEGAGLGGRVVAAAAAGVIIARRAAPAPGRHEVAVPPTPDVQTDPVADGPTTLACGVLAIATAVGAAWLGVRWRAVGSGRTSTRLLSAVVEDAAVIGLAAAAARP